MSLLPSVIGSCRRILVRPLLRYCSTATEAQEEDSQQATPQISPEDDFAYNDVEKKKGKLKPSHSVETQIAYMKSKAFENAYKGLPVYKWFRRNIATQLIIQPPPRLRCIDAYGRLKMNNACPICRDEYLFFDYRNPDLIKQFLIEGTDKPVSVRASGLCYEQYVNLRAQLLKAREHGTIEFNVEFRSFDYSEWYPDWKSEEEEEDGARPTRHSTRFESVFQADNLRFPEHILDQKKGFDFFMDRHKKFARLGK